jgi:hypothetical protein
LERENGRSKVAVYDWLNHKRSIVVDDIISVPSPLRNKSEFTFGYRYLLPESLPPNKDTEETATESILPSYAEPIVATGDELSATTTTSSIPKRIPAVGYVFVSTRGFLMEPNTLLIFICCLHHL